MPEFINPSMLGFLALGSIPIIIYLINRQHYRRVQWAAMEFLLRAMKKNRRRLRLESLLLLLIRTCVILLFVFGMARPIFDDGVLPVLGSTSRTEAFVIDRSYSMALHEGTHTVLADAVRLAKQRMKGMSRVDRVGVFLAGGFPEALFSEPQAMTDEIHGRIIEQLESVPIAYERCDVATTLQFVAQWIEGAKDVPACLVHFYTDLQQADWLTGEGGVNGAIQEALRRLEEMKVRVKVHDLGPPRSRNATVVSLVSKDPVLCIDLPTSFQVRVENHGRDLLAGLELEFWINDVLQGARSLSIDAMGSHVISFPHVFRETGLARVSAVLKTDDLVEDNVAFGVFPVRDGIDVLVVDGGREGGEASEETAWLVVAIGPEIAGDSVSGRLTPYRTHTIAPDRINAMKLERYGVVVLVDVPAFSPQECELIEEYLRAGGGALAFLGERVSPASYAANAYRGGEGWFPYAPGTAVTDPRQEILFALNVTAKEHPAVSYLASTPEAGLSLVRLHGYVSVASQVPASAVLMRLNDFQETPALVERSFGKGSLLVLNTGADRSWSNFAVSPAFLCFLHEALPYLAVRSDVIRNLAINEPFPRVIPSAEYSQRVYLFVPDGDSRPLALRARDDGATFDLEVPGQRQPGIYEIRYGMEAGTAAARQEWFAVNADPKEGNLTRADVAALSEAYPGPVLGFEEVSKRAEDGAAAAGDRGEIWRTLFWAVLALLVVESVLARWFGAPREKKR
ncbi:MAG: BatA domain-containing protein [Planctomycetes bacterium]|nr:BatA domain-containing protein [Planctomycetota bacterium]